MAKVKEIALGRPHQMAVCRFARKQFMKRSGGIVLADGVGLGKTYEALGTLAAWLGQLQYGKERKRRKKYRVLILVPPGLVTKWADELQLPDRFPRYLENWKADGHQAVVESFADVAVLRGRSDLEKKKGEQRYGRNVLPPGLYVTNSNLLFLDGKKAAQICRTPWDTVIIDEAHHIADRLPKSERGRELLARSKTRTLLLTATPFQLTPQEMKGLIAATYGGDEAKAKALYGDTAFAKYRRALMAHFNSADLRSIKEAKQQRQAVETLLRPRIVRNRKSERRRYHLVTRDGEAHSISGNPFWFDDGKLSQMLKGRGLIDLSPEEAMAYVAARDGIAEVSGRDKTVFVAQALRQWLSTREQFRYSATARHLEPKTLPPTSHPKMDAAVNLVTDLIAAEVEKGGQGWIGKVLIFTTFVGSGRSTQAPQEDEAYGTAAALKKALMKSLGARFLRPKKEQKALISERLLVVVKKHGDSLDVKESKQLCDGLRRLSATGLAYALLGSPENLSKESSELRRLLQNIVKRTKAKGRSEETETQRRLTDRRKRCVQELLNRYATRDLVARYDGATRHEDRDRHLHGFNSPFAPLVLIASSVGQEGIDLQQYCRHVIHYDLEWNPAKLEQREGRVDRPGRRTKGPVNVYFLLCRDTYDERMMHVMVNRFRWHHVLLANRAVLESDFGTDLSAAPALIRSAALDLRPPALRQKQ